MAIEFYLNLYTMTKENYQSWEHEKTQETIETQNFKKFNHLYDWVYNNDNFRSWERGKNILFWQRWWHAWHINFPSTNIDPNTECSIIRIWADWKERSVSLQKRYITWERKTITITRKGDNKTYSAKVFLSPEGTTETITPLTQNGLNILFTEFNKFYDAWHTYITQKKAEKTANDKKMNDKSIREAISSTEDELDNELNSMV